MAPPTREERRLMRQRGAGTREIQNVNFGFTFGAPSTATSTQARPTARRTSRSRSGSAQPRRTPRPSARKTPRGSSGRESASAGRRSKEKTGSGERKGEPGDDGPGQETLFVTPSATRKRKRGSDATTAEDANRMVELETVAEDEPDELGSANGPQPQLSKRLQTSEVFVDAEKALDDLPGSGNNRPEQSEIVSDNRRRRPTRLAAITEGEGKENTGEPSQTIDTEAKSSGKKRVAMTLSVQPGGTVDSPSVQLPSATRSPLADVHNEATGSRRSSLQQIARATPLQSPAVVAQPGSTPQIASARAVNPLLRRSLQRSARSTPTPVPEDASSDDELTPARSTPQASSRRLSRGTPIPADESSRAPDELASNQADEEEVVEISSDEELDESESESEPGFIDTTAAVVVAEDDEAEEDAQESTTSDVMPPPRPPPSRRATRLSSVVSATDPSSHAETTAPPNAPRLKKRRSNPTTTTDNKSTVPITIYRLWAPPAPISSDPTTTPPPTDLPTLPARPNPVDVLTQISLELTTRLAAALARQSASAPRAADARAFARKQRGVRAFADALADRLFGLTCAVDAGAVLSARVKEARREVGGLREELLEVRRRRAEVAVELDRVRREWEGKREAWARREKVGRGVADLEVAVERGRARERRAVVREEGDGEVGLMEMEGLLREVGEKVGRDGVLQRIKAFNARLERTAEVLEARM